MVFRSVHHVPPTLWADFHPLVCATALRCARCGWRASRRWTRDELAGWGRGLALDEAVVREAQRWLGTPSVEHHREERWGLARITALGVAEAMQLGRRPRPYVPGFFAHARVLELEVALRLQFSGSPALRVTLRAGDDAPATLGAAMRRHDPTWTDLSTETRGEIARRFTWWPVG
jgi:hypothetical protein